MAKGIEWEPAFRVARALLPADRRGRAALQRRVKPPKNCHPERSGEIYFVNLSAKSRDPVVVVARAAEHPKYMHRNPVVRGLAEKPDDWRRSSFRSYAYGEKGLVRINDWRPRKEKIRDKAG